MHSLAFTRTARGSLLLTLGALAWSCSSADDVGAGDDPAAPGSSSSSGAAPRPTDGGSGSDARAPNDAGITDGVAPDVLAFAGPSAGSELLYSAAVRLAVPTGVDSVEVRSGTQQCVARAPVFECLLDLGDLPVGALAITATAKTAAGEVTGTASVDVVRREVPVPCTGNANALAACIVARAEAGTSAGFVGVSYVNADNAHANLNTSAMTGIDAHVLATPPPALPDGVTLGIMNESTAWILTGGRCSLTRCNPFARRALALQYYEQGVLYFHPEHRDVGLRDFFQWQAPFFVASQGSSSSELDEVGKSLRALGILRAEVRAAVQTHALGGPLSAFLVTRSRQTTDAAYLAPDAWPTAMPNETNEERGLALAAALRAPELPPSAKLTATPTFPADWNMQPALTSPYALGYAPSATPGAAPAGTFSIDVDLATSLDANARPLSFFPSVLRGGADVVVERTGPSTFRVRGSYPVDATITTGGQSRIVSRTTVGFFPHNGVWLGTPAMLSVGARAAEEVAPDSNNLD